LPNYYENVPQAVDLIFKEDKLAGKPQIGNVSTHSLTPGA